MHLSLTFIFISAVISISVVVLSNPIPTNRRTASIVLHRLAVFVGYAVIISIEGLFVISRYLIIHGLLPLVVHSFHSSSKLMMISPIDLKRFVTWSREAADIDPLRVDVREETAALISLDQLASGRV